MEMGVCGINVCGSPPSPFLIHCFSVLFVLNSSFIFVVTFRMVVFRPFVSEVLLAKVKSSDEDGIRRMFLFGLALPST